MIKFQHRYEMLKLACVEHNKEKGLYNIPNEWEGTQKDFFDFPYIHNKFKDEIDQFFQVKIYLFFMYVEEIFLLKPNVIIKMDTLE